MVGGCCIYMDNKGGKNTFSGLFGTLHGTLWLRLNKVNAGHHVHGRQKAQANVNCHCHKSNACSKGVGMYNLSGGSVYLWEYNWVNISIHVAILGVKRWARVWAVSSRPSTWRGVPNKLQYELTAGRMTIRFHGKANCINKEKFIIW